MHTVQRILKNTAVSYGSQMAGYAMALFYMMVAARFLGPSIFGVLTFALAFTNLFAVFCDFGLQPLMTREVARNKTMAPKYLANIVGIKVILSILTLGFIFATISFLGYPQQTILIILILGLWIVTKAFNSILQALFQAHEHMEYQAFQALIAGAIMLVGVIFAVWRNLNVIYFACIYLVSGMGALLYGFFVFATRFTEVFSRWQEQMIEMDWSFHRSTIKEAFPFGMAMAFLMTFYWTDSVMLSIMKGDEVVGCYNAAYRLVLSLLFIPNGLIAALYPVMSRHYKSSETLLELFFQKSFKYLTLIAIPLGILTTLLARRIILLIYGNQYDTSVLPLQILIWSTVLIFMSQPFGNLFNARNKQSIVLRTTGICAGLNLLLNLALIPRFSLLGASIATVLTECASLVLLAVWWKKDLHLANNSIRPTGFLLKVALATGTMCLVTLGCYNLHLMFLVPLALVTYMAMLYLTAVIQKDDFLFRPLNHRHHGAKGTVL